ncbi:reverse transcriptase-rnase h-integrase [Moniliophthora roreri MCA 2997]|uniref:Reverse transcriptase-rnase h-integrase n=1 Tax=Moniliophthora roreri (strain MCA 2997) TaxID=1381753 RepID=V2WI70_MONRO|nr:reverse transcriptase-rnase h-integrase [Moniliophthora roreri MCA 2997]
MLKEHLICSVNRRQVRWSLFLSEFDLTLVHVLGKSLTQADALSQRTTKWDDEDTDNENMVLLPERLFIKEVNLELKEEIIEQLGLDDFHKLALEMLMTQGVPPIKSALLDWEIKDDLLFFKGGIYVPNDTELQ